MSNITFYSTIAIFIILPVLIALSFSDKKEVLEIANTLRLAGRVQRIINFVIDAFAILIIWILLLNLVALVLPEDTNSYTAKNRAMKFAVASGLFAYFAYYILLEYFFQLTAGKLLSGTKVVSVDGARPTLEQIIYRTMARGIPFEFVTCLLLQEGLHDKLSSTVVVKREKK